MTTPHRDTLGRALFVALVAGVIGLPESRAAGIRVRMRPMERAAFYAAWREKKLRGLFLTAVGNSGNAASRVQEFIQSKGSYAYGGYPDIDDLFQQQARERDPKKREALLHRIQQLTVDRVMSAPVMDLRALLGGGSTNRRTHDHVGRDESLPVLRGREAQGETPLRFGSLDHIEPVPTASPPCQERGPQRNRASH